MQDPSRERKPRGGAPSNIDAALAAGDTAANTAAHTAANPDTATASAAAAAAAGPPRRRCATAAAFGVSFLARAADFVASATTAAFDHAEGNARAANFAGSAAAVGANCFA